MIGSRLPPDIAGLREARPGDYFRCHPGRRAGGVAHLGRLRDLTRQTEVGNFQRLVSQVVAKNRFQN